MAKRPVHDMESPALHVDFLCLCVPTSKRNCNKPVWPNECLFQRTFFPSTSTSIPVLLTGAVREGSHRSGCLLYAGHGGTVMTNVIAAPPNPVQSDFEISFVVYPARKARTCTKQELVSFRIGARLVDILRSGSRGRGTYAGYGQEGGAEEVDGALALEVLVLSVRDITRGEQRTIWPSMTSRMGSSSASIFSFRE